MNWASLGSRWQPHALPTLGRTRLGRFARDDAVREAFVAGDLCPQSCSLWEPPDSKERNTCPATAVHHCAAGGRAPRIMTPGQVPGGAAGVARSHENVVERHLPHTSACVIRSYRARGTPGAERLLLASASRVTLTLLTEQVPSNKRAPGPPGEDPTEA